MEKSEFITRTRFDPMDEEYRVIEQLYYDFKGDKDTFCKHFASDGGNRDFFYRRADTIRRLEEKLKEAAESTERRVKDLETEIVKLKVSLDKELEWKPCRGGTNLDQERCEDLLHACGTELLTDDEANKHNQMRVLQRHKRKTAYNATDWNCILFNCACWMHKMVNGSLQTYEC